ncbi:glycosyltransferase family 4 protein [Demequina aestuarii]|uniref:glycosyltransferase family 4 protein n=1 Tax=Demequina aestuarii TaxID=327095 RepID=UPI000781AE8B|nr:glycosyltransferase family 4 protein [Demequina aestuarii]
MRLAIVTPWFPTEDSPYSGTFVREWLKTLTLPPGDVTVIHCRSVGPDEQESATEADEEYGRVIRITVPHDGMLSRAETAVLHREAISRHASEALAAADAVHAHVGMPTAAAVAGLVRPEQSFLTVEHATYTRALVAHPTAAPAYRQMLERSHVHLVVGEDTARTIRRAFPDLSATVVTSGNPVDGRVFALRAKRPVALSRWLFIGNLIDRKGVHRAIGALDEFAARHPDRSDLRLSIVGQGPMRERLEALAEEVGVADRVDFLGPREPEDLPALMAEHDLLVHLADLETFGLTIVEAAAAGLPVVVTTCAGPEETMAGPSRYGQAALVGLPARRADVADAVEGLESAAPTADPAAARAAVLEAYGREAFGTRLARASAGGPFHAEPDDDAPIVVVVALTRDGARRVRYAVPELIRRGNRVRFVTARTDEARMADARALPLNIRPQLNRRLAFKAEAGVMGMAPEAAAKAVRTVLAPALRMGGAVGRVARGGTTSTNRGLARWRRSRARGEAALLRRHLTGSRPAQEVEAIDSAWMVATAGSTGWVLAADRESLSLAGPLASALGAAHVVGPDDVDEFLSAHQR